MPVCRLSRMAGHFWQSVVLATGKVQRRTQAFDSVVETTDPYVSDPTVRGGVAWPGSDVSGARCLGFGDALWSADDTGVRASLQAGGSWRNARSAAVNFPLWLKRFQVQRYALVLKPVLNVTSFSIAAFSAMAMHAWLARRSLPAMPSWVVLQHLIKGHWQSISRPCRLTQPLHDRAASVATCATDRQLIDTMDAIICFIMRGPTLGKLTPMGDAIATLRQSGTIART